MSIDLRTDSARILCYQQLPNPADRLVTWLLCNSATGPGFWRHTRCSAIMDTVNNFPQGGQMIKVRISQSKDHSYENYNMCLASTIVYNYSHVTDSNVMASFVRNFSLKLKTEYRARHFDPKPSWAWWPSMVLLIKLPSSLVRYRLPSFTIAERFLGQSPRKLSSHNRLGSALTIMRP